jgi:phospholipid transport system substrate-binding protein
MIKTLLIILTILQTNLSFAQTPKTPIGKEAVTEILNPPGPAALSIMLNALSSLKVLRKAGHASLENTTHLVKLKILPFIAIEASAKVALAKHWSKLSLVQKQVFEDYITQSLLRDYVGMLDAYEGLNKVEISLHKKIARKDNKALVTMEIKVNDHTKPTLITLKMIRNEQWKIYDLVFSGVSIIKSYRSQFDSHIKRKSLDDLIQKTTKKLQQK